MDWNRELHRLTTDGLPETRGLEFKEALLLDTSRQKRDLLADLSGMANGGGGVVIYGIAERRGLHEAGLADRVAPLLDKTLLARLHDLTRDTIRPPLMFEATSVQAEGGYVLVIELSAPTLGPHMIEVAEEFRYYTRIGTSVVRMNEQQVRDAHMLVARRLDRRSQVWREHEMPPRLEPGPWLSVSVVPLEPLTPRFRAAEIHRPAFGHWAELGHLLTVSGLGSAIDNLRMWAHGLAGSGATNGSFDTAVARIHEDGSVTGALYVDESWTITTYARVVNSVCAWIARVLNDVHIAQNVEVLIRLDKVSLTTLSTFGSHGGLQVQLAPQLPAGIDQLGPLDVRAELSAASLMSAPIRHGLIREFTDRVTAAFGLARATTLFETGPLFNHDGAATGVAAVGHRLEGYLRPDIYLHDDGAVIVGNNSKLVGYLVDGAFINVDGDTLAVTELAIGYGCPRDFVPRQHGSGVPSGVLGDRLPRHGAEPPPTPTGQWSEVPFITHLANTANQSIGP